MYKHTDSKAWPACSSMVNPPSKRGQVSRGLMMAPGCKNGGPGMQIDAQQAGWSARLQHELAGSTSQGSRAAYF